MSFKIAGVSSGSSKGPYKKGEIIPLSPEEKLIAQCKDEVCAKASEGYAYLITDASIVGSVQYTKGRGVKFGEPSQYMGEVRVTMRPLDLKTDRVHSEKVEVFKLHIEDCFDDLGIDDLKTITFTKND